MIPGKLSVVLLMSGLSFCSGCAMNGMKSPIRNPLASLDFRQSNSTRASETDLSPEFRAAQKEFKKDPEGTLLAWALWQEDVGEYGEARKKYRELLVAYPDNIEAQLGLARIELSCGRVKQAEDILLAVAKQRPTNASVRLELGRLYTHQEDWQKAIAAFEDASSMDRENQVCRYELGVAFARCHRYDQALSHLTYAVGESAANYNIGYVLHEQGNDADATEWFQNALQTHPDTRTAEKTQAMLAQLSPKNSRDRSATRMYPPANPSAQAIARQPKPATIDQFEPASFKTPGVQPATLLAPVIQQPAGYGMASPSNQPTATIEGRNPLRTVSHAVPQEQAGQLEIPGSQLPPWRGASPQTAETKGQTIAPAKWRGL